MFVIEKMPEEAKVNLPFDVAVESDGSKPTLWKWAVDKAQDAYMVATNVVGGSYSGVPITKYFMMSWRGNLIPISAEPVGHKFNELGTTVLWKINEISLPEALLANRGEVITLIKDAFKAIGEFFDGERYAGVEVDFESALDNENGSSK